MSDDEYDDGQPLDGEYDGEYDGDNQSLDDDLEASLNAPANEALERLRARERPTENDVKLFEPFYQKLADQERIPFLIVQDSLVLGFNGVLYPDRLGGHHVRMICQSAERTSRQDQCISLRQLDSGGTVGSGGMLYSGNPGDSFEPHDDNDGFDRETPYQQSAFEGAIEPKYMHAYVADAKKLINQGYTAKTSELLKFYEETIYQGRIKGLDLEEEKIRQRVSQNIKNFYEMLEGKKYGNDESRRISAYFKRHINYRHGDYWYTGKWKFRYF